MRKTHAHGRAIQLAGFFSIFKMTFLFAGALFQTNAIAAGNWAQKPSWAAASTKGDRDSGDDSPAPLFSSGGGSASRRSTLREDHSSYSSSISPFSPGSNNVSLGVGQIFLMGDLSSNYMDSIGTKLSYTMGVSEMFALEAALGYSSHSDSKYSMTTALAGMRVNLSWYDKVVPHAVIGMGFFNPTYEISPAGPNGKLSETISPILFGVHAGPGIDLQLTKQIFFGASLRFYDMFSTVRYTEAGERKEIAGTFTSLLLHTGVSF